MTTIVTELGKFRYNLLPMGMFASRGISQPKLDKLLGDIKGVKTYIDDIIVLGKDTFENHMEQMALSHKLSCSLRCARYVNSSKIERLFMVI